MQKNMRMTLSLTLLFVIAAHVAPAADQAPIAQGGGYVSLPPSGNFQVHRHSFAFSLREVGERLELQLQYQDHHEGAASGPVHDEPAAFGIHMNSVARFTRGSNWVYFEGPGIRRVPTQKGSPGTTKEYVCVWAEDGSDRAPDRFHLETAPQGSVPGYTSGGANLGCSTLGPPSRFILPDDSGYIVGGGNITAFSSLLSAKNVPLIDAHLHAIRGSSVEEMSAVLARVWQAGVSGVVLFGWPQDVDDLLQPLQAQYPDYVFPFIQTGRDPDTRKLLLDKPAVNAIRDQLQTALFRGIGELTLRHRPFGASPKDGDRNNACGDVANNNYVDDIYKLGAEFDVPVNVHVEHNAFDLLGRYGLFGGELECALGNNPATNIIWAHMGDAQADEIQRMMGLYPNLYADLSTRNPFFSGYRRGVEPEDLQRLTNEDGTLKEEWRTAFEEFPDRFLFGSDVDSRGERLRDLESVVQYFRSVLAQLTPGTADRIANGNLRRLLGLR